MHHFKYILAFALLLGSSVAFAQQTIQVGAMESDFGKFYIRIGANLPQGQFKKTFDPNIPLYENVGIRGGMSGGRGANLELGRYFFFHEYPIVDLFKIGLDATFLSVAYTPIDWPSPDGENMDFAAASLGIKLGPVVSFNILEGFYVDAFFKVAPTYLFAGESPYYLRMDGANYEELYLHLYSDYEEGSPLFALKNDIGINLRYRKGSLAFSYESGTFEPEVEYASGQEGSSPDDEGTYGYRVSKTKMPMGVFQIKLGLQFY